MKRLVFAALLLDLPASAATPDSWMKLDRDARAACGKDIVRQAGKAKVTGTAGKVLGIGIGKESDWHYGLILTSNTAGYRSQWLRLYDKCAKTAAAREVVK